MKKKLNTLLGIVYMVFSFRNYNSESIPQKNFEIALLPTPIPT